MNESTLPAASALEPRPASPAETDVAHDIAALADALPFLVIRDDARPAAWMTPMFTREVAALRTMLAPAGDLATLAMMVRRLDRGASIALGPVWHGPLRPRSFESAARQLASDAVSVAIAIRWQEIHGDLRLPSWPDLLHQHSMAGHPLDPDLDTRLWFG